MCQKNPVHCYIMNFSADFRTTSVVRLFLFDFLSLYLSTSSLSFYAIISMPMAFLSLSSSYIYISIFFANLISFWFYYFIVSLSFLPIMNFTSSLSPFHLKSFLFHFEIIFTLFIVFTCRQCIFRY